MGLPVLATTLVRLIVRPLVVLYARAIGGQARSMVPSWGGGGHAWCLAAGVFLSYRRDDAGPYARSLQLQLSQRISDALIFMDLDSIEPGLDFAEVMEEAVNSSAVLVALIGRQWATLTDEDGVRRLDNPDDYVRFEVKTALEQGVRVIPVLIDGARALRRQDLPAELRKLGRLNAHNLSYDRYQDDADRLLDLIQRVLATASEEPRPERVLGEASATVSQPAATAKVGAPTVPTTSDQAVMPPARRTARTLQLSETSLPQSRRQLPDLRRHRGSRKRRLSRWDAPPTGR
jgi:hypothetical protein